MVNDAPVSTVASMSRTRWPSMLDMRSGHLKVPIGKPRHRNVYRPILPDFECLLQRPGPLTTTRRFINDKGNDAVLLNQSQGGNYILQRWQRRGSFHHQCVGSGL